MTSFFKPYTYLLLAAVFSFLILFSSAANAQAPGGRPAPAATGIKGVISGKVIDSLSNKPLDYATISLFPLGSTTPLTGSLTDDKGSFKLNEVPAGRYRLSINYIGYPTKNIQPVITTPAKPDNNIGNIAFSSGSKTLNEVVVVGEQALIENKIDKLVFNAEKDVTSAGGNASDVLQKVPMLSLDINGNVSLRGNQNVRILINGKPSGAMASSAADILKSMPADQIKSVEVITSPSAKYDAEGTAGIINIITKKKNISGVSGSVSGGAGTRQNNGNVNLNVNKNRLSVATNLGANYGWPNSTTSSFSFSDSATGASSFTNGKSESKRLFTNGSATLGYDINNSNSLSSTINFRSGSFKNSGSSISSNTSAASGTVDYSSLNSNKNASGNFDWNADWTHKFKKEGSDITVAGQWSHSNNDVDYESTYTAFGTDQRAENLAKNNEYTAQVDYTLPINKELKLEAGTKGIFRKINSTYDFFNPDATGEYVFNGATSNEYLYNQNVYAGYGVLTATLKGGYGIQTGLRIENTDIDGNSNNENLGLQAFNSNYTNFVPNIALSKTLENKNTIKISYNKRIQRPSIQFLNPFLNTNDLTNQSQGNPELAPEIAQTFDLNYAANIKGSFINASVYYRNTKDIIESYVSTVPFTTVDNDGVSSTRDVSRTQYANIGTNNSFGTSVSGSVTLAKIVTLRGSVNAYTYKPKVYEEFLSSTNPITSTYVQYNVFVSGGVKLPGGFAAETFLVQNSPRRTFQGETPSFSIWNIGMKKEILKKKGTIGLTVVQPFSKNLEFNSQIRTATITQNSQFAVPIRSVGINFSWNFGKMNYGQTPKKKKGINNDDLKEGEGNQGGVGG
jgi:outer membrane receptor protein involved in Fe transport